MNLNAFELFADGLNDDADAQETDATTPRRSEPTSESLETYSGFLKGSGYISALSYRRTPL